MVVDARSVVRMTRIFVTEINRIEKTTPEVAAANEVELSFRGPVWSDDRS